jgi:hypothetical protein
MLIPSPVAVASLDFCSAKISEIGRLISALLRLDVRKYVKQLYLKLVQKGIFSIPF